MYQVQVSNPVTGAFKMVGEVKDNMKALESTNKRACAKVWGRGLLVKTVKL